MKLLSIFLSLLVLFSTSSISLDAHYCSDSLQDLAINKKAKSCCIEVAVDSKNYSEDTCCSEKTIQKGSQKDLKDSSLLFKLEFLFGTGPYIFRMNTPLSIREKHFSYYYKPPLIVKDYNMLFEVFLI